jgi:hypothetical protein
MRVTYKASTDTYANEAKPKTTFGQSPELLVANQSTSRKWTYIHLPIPDVDEDSTVVSALLSLTLRAASPGSLVTLTFERINEKWGGRDLNWNKKPLVGASSGDSQTLAVAANTAGGATVQANLTAMIHAAVQQGRKWFGVRIISNVNATIKFHSGQTNKGENKPKMIVDINQVPDAATGLKPGGGAAISKAKPTLSAKAVDPDGEDGVGNIWVKISSSATTDVNGMLTTTIFDTGWVASSELALDLEFTAFGGLTDGQVVYWQMKWKDARGAEAPWSEVETFRRRLKGTVNITSPGATSDSNEVEIESTHTKFTTAATYELRRGNATGKLIWRNRAVLGVAASTVISTSIPTGYVTDVGVNYAVVVKADDDESREDRPNDPGYAEASKVFQWSPGGAVGAPSALTVVDTEMPLFYLQFTRSTAPDWFTLLRNGQAIRNRINPANVNYSGTTYRIPIYEAKLGANRTWGVTAVVNGSHSSQVTVVFNKRVPGVWVTDRNDGLMAPLYGNIDWNLVIGEDAERVTLQGSRVPRRTYSAVRGNEGTVGGIVHAQSFLSLDAALDAWRELKARSSRGEADLQILYYGAAYGIVIGTISIQPTSQHDIWAVSVEVDQISDYEITGVA